MRRAGVAVGALVLGLGPLLGLFHQPPRAQPADSSVWFPAAMHAKTDNFVPALRPAVSRSFPANDGCTCRTVEVNLDNFVRDADIRTGDARVLNVNVTYVAPGFVQAGDAEIDVDQEADATSGDAIAGQILGIAARAARGGCTHVIVNATNDVADSKLRSGDARATNKNFVLLDPAVRRGDVEVDVKQRARAKSGETIAGQILGINAAGAGPCGGVDVKASNNVKNVELETGEARTDNENSIKQCESAGCVKELWQLVRRQHLDGVRMCGADGCSVVSADELHEMYHEMKAAEDAADPPPTPKPKHHKGDPTPTPTDDGSAPPSDVATPTPTPSPTPSSDMTTSAMAEPGG